MKFRLHEILALGLVCSVSGFLPPPFQGRLSVQDDFEVQLTAAC